MAALDFPASSSSPWTAPNGVIYTWNADGYWEAKADPNDFDTDYLKLNATNDPVTGNLALDQDLAVGDNLAVTGTSDFTGDVSAAANLAVTGTSDFTGLTTHEAGISVTGGGIDGNTSNIFKAVSSSSQVNPFIISTNDNVGVSITSPGAVNVYGTTYRQTSGNPAYRFQIGTGGFHPTSTNQTACFVKSDFTTNQPTAGGAYSHFVVSSQAGGTHQGELNGFYCGSISQGVSNTAGTKVIGFKSDIDNDGAKPNIEAYNFYAAGDAPNYFAGNVGIGTDDPQGKLDVDGNAFFRNVIVSNGIRSVSDDQAANWGGNQAAKYYASGGSATHGSQGFTADSIGAGTDNEAIHFLSRGTDSDNNNNYSFRTSLDNSTGTGKNYAFYAEGSAPNYFAGGVQFGTAAGTDALKDYEEGTFTPVFTNPPAGVNYTSQRGTYVKIGTIVNIYLEVSYDNASGNDTIEINLPFYTVNLSGAANSGQGYCTVYNATGSSIAGESVSVGMARNNNKFWLLKGAIRTQNAQNSQIKFDDIPTAQLRITACYNTRP